MPYSKRINIAVDGQSSCGKGTLARAVARELDYLFIDSGAMYRAVTLAIIHNHIDVTDTAAVEALLPTLTITFKHNNERNYHHTFLNGEDVEKVIRSMEVSGLVSPVSQIPAVRRFLVAQQQAIGKDKGVIMDGRDIGTVVFPDAELKIFMTASAEVRAQRRLKELHEKGDTTLTYEDVYQNLTTRDHLDSTRKDSPMKPAADARILDNTHLNKQQQLELVMGWVRSALDTSAAT